MARSNTMNKRKVVKKNNTLVVKITNKTKKATKPRKQTRTNNKNVSSRRKTLKKKLGGFRRQTAVKKRQIIGPELKLPINENNKEIMKKIIENAEVIFFDFDLTISNKHTGGRPKKKAHEINNSWKTVMSKLQNMGKEIVINTRGMQDQISEVMKTEFPGINITVMGADESIPISNNKKGINRKKWAEIKTIFIEQYMFNKHSTNNHIDKKKVLFFDDTKENIEEARNKGYVYSLYHNPPIANELGKFLEDILKDDYESGYDSSSNMNNNSTKKEEIMSLLQKIEKESISGNGSNAKPRQELKKLINSLTNHEYSKILEHTPDYQKPELKLLRNNRNNNAGGTKAYEELVQGGIPPTIETEE